MIIEVVLDTVCPWCFIGKRRLSAALAKRPGIDVQLRWRPFLLNPQMPPEGIDRETYLVKKFGGIHRVRRIYGAIGDAGLDVGIPFAFDRIRTTPNTLNSHRVLRLSESIGVAETLVEKMFQAYFLEGRDIGRPEVLVELAGECGMDMAGLAAYLETDEDVELILEENARAHRQGINGVPTYILDGRVAVSGAHDPNVLARMLDVASEMDGEPALFADSPDTSWSSR